MYKHYDLIKEDVYRETLDNGLKVSIVQKKGFKRTMVLFGTNYGSFHSNFRINNGNEVISTPQGIAHFLEHKLFSNEDGTDATTTFSEYGLDVNAFTDYNQTVYLFSGTSNIKKGIEMLLDFVQSPYFTDEGIEQEKGIISQELNMYLDNPSDRLYYGTLKNMFFEYPVKNDVGGTVEEINKINKELLYKCYNLFYHPSNMELLIIGDIDCNEILNLIKKNQENKKFNEFENPIYYIKEERQEVVRKSSNIKMEVSIPAVQVGLKLPFHKLEKNQLIVYEVLLKVLLEYAFGSNTSFHQNLLDNEIISSHLGYSVTIDNNCGFIIIKADSKQPEKFIKLVSKKLISLKNISITEKIFSRLKKSVLGSFIKALNSIDFIAYNYLDYNLKNCDLFESINLIMNKNISDIKKLEPIFKDEAITSFIIYPKNKS